MKKIHSTSLSWNIRDKILLLENLEMYVSAGLMLDEALRISSGLFSAKQNKVLIQVHVHVSQGNLLSSAFAKYIQFSPTLIALIEHGEHSGNLIQSLRMARMVMERQDILIKACLSALTYPIVIA
ncbi:MAG: type II secretion system F family protein, partial [Candidatus Pacebacteria bacterium]|nr:type II secretion system F family protein [Candidatus Paceibacterota bacterium]